LSSVGELSRLGFTVPVPYSHFFLNFRTPSVGPGSPPQSKKKKITKPRNSASSNRSEIPPSNEEVDNDASLKVRLYLKEVSC